MPGSCCAVFGCKNYHSSSKHCNDITYHTFPKDKSLRKIWLSKCYRNGINPNTARICSEHFTEGDFERNLKAELLGLKTRKILLKNSVPSLKLPLDQCVFSTTSKERAGRARTRERKQLVNEILQNSTSSCDNNSSTSHESLKNSTFSCDKNRSNSQESHQNSTFSCDKNSSASQESPQNSTFSCDKNSSTSFNDSSILNDSSKETSLNSFNSDVSTEDISGGTLVRSNFCYCDKEEALSQHLKLKCDNDTCASELRRWKNRYSALKLSLKKKNNVIRELKFKVLEKSFEVKKVNKELKRVNKVTKRPNYLKERSYNILRKLFSESQIKMLLGKKKVRWSSDDIAKAFAIRYFSKRVYIFLREKCNFPLPHISTLQRYAAKMDVNHGFLEDVFKLMKSTGYNLPELEKIVVLNFDEVKVRSLYEYDQKQDQIVGKHSQLQVIMARGLFSSWKQPLYLGFDKKMSKDILNTAICKLRDAGFIVKACVCDMGGSNMALWRELGVSTSRTYFCSTAAPNELIYCFADAPHLLKLIRNWFLDYGFNINGVEVKKDPIIKLINDDNSELKICNKLTKLHVECIKTERQNVRLAAELMSHTVATAVRRMAKGSDETLLETANLIDTVNKWFDILNSYRKEDGSKSGFGIDLEGQNEALTNMIHLMESMRCIKKSQNCLQMFQKGTIVTTKSLQSLWFDLNNKYGTTYLLTHRLNQDCLENFFSQLRTRGGLDDHPTPLNALYRIRMIILGKNPGIVVSNSNTSSQINDEYFVTNIFRQSEVTFEDIDIEIANEDIFLRSCDKDIEANINMNNSSNKDNLRNISVLSPSKNSEAHNNILNLNSISKKAFTKESTKENYGNLINEAGLMFTSELQTFSEHEEGGLEYLAGWVAKKCKNKYPDLNLTNETKNKLDHNYSIPTWVSQLSYGGILVPSKEFFDTVKNFETIFSQYHYAYSKKNAISNEVGIVTNVTNEIQKEIPNFPREIITVFVKIRTLIKMRFLNNLSKNVNKDNKEGETVRKTTKKMKKITK